MDAVFFCFYLVYTLPGGMNRTAKDGLILSVSESEASLDFTRFLSDLREQAPPGSKIRTIVFFQVSEKIYEKEFPNG